MNATGSESANRLGGLDYSVVQQCMHCGMCLPACPTYVETRRERSSPRGRIAMMRAIADGRMEVSRTFAEEIYFCLGCLACQSACPAGVDYAALFESARAQVEGTGVLAGAFRTLVRRLSLNGLFTSRRRLRALARGLYLYQRSGLEALGRRALPPGRMRELAPLLPRVQWRSTAQRFHREGQRNNPPAPRYRVGLLSGCVQDIAFVDLNLDTVFVLQENGCEVVLPPAQQCCGSLHAHNGEIESARRLARRNIAAFAPGKLDAIIVNAGGCGSHMKRYDHLLAGDPAAAEGARQWSSRVRDIHEFLLEIDFRVPRGEGPGRRVTYHDSCHLKHGQQVWEEPRQVLRSLPGLELVELEEADWCCGSAGIYNITQPRTAMKLLERKMGHIRATGAELVATGNPGCAIQLSYGSVRSGLALEVQHPVSLLAAAYRAEKAGAEKGENRR